MLGWVRRERGQDLVETALVLPIVLLLVLGIIEFALVFLSYNTICDAAREAARWGVIVDAGTGFRTEAQIEAKAYEVTAAAGLAGAQAFATLDASAQTVHVLVTYDVPIITPFLGLPAIHLQAESTKQLEVE